MNRLIVHSAAILLGAFCVHGASAAGWLDLRNTPPLHGDIKAGEARAATNCVACHRLGQPSVMPSFPLISGQRAEYLANELRKAKLGNRPESPMMSLAAPLTEDDIRNLSAYYAAQPRTVAGAGDADADTRARGEALYMHGNPEQGVPPCQGCHGTDANGPQSERLRGWPSLRGQNGEYVSLRLQAYRDGKLNDSSSDAIMRGVAQSLDDESIRALAGWLSSLPPAAR